MSTVQAPSKSKPHQRYYITENGKKRQVPGVTSILGNMAKPALKYWANRLGLNGIDVKGYVDEKADAGTCAHYMIECDIAGQKPDLDGFSKNTINDAESGYLKWLEWKDRHDVVPIASELQLSSHHHRYGGTVDFYGIVDGRQTMVDFKTSGSGIYPDMEAQAIAYKMLLLENGYDVDDVWILRIGRDETEGFEERRIDPALHQPYFDIFLNLRSIYDLKKQVGWR